LLKKSAISRVKDLDPFPIVLRSGSVPVAYGNKHKKIIRKGKFNSVCLLVGFWQTYCKEKSSE
jgi:hypothetical protein